MVHIIKKDIPGAVVLGPREMNSLHFETEHTWLPGKSPAERLSDSSPKSTNI